MDKDNEVKKDYDKIDYLDNNFSETNNNDLTGNIGQYISVLVKNIKTGEKLLETSEPKDISIMGDLLCISLYFKIPEKLWAFYEWRQCKTE